MKNVTVVDAVVRLQPRGLVRLECFKGETSNPVAAIEDIDRYAQM